MEEYDSSNVRMHIDRDEKNTLNHCNSILQRVYVLRNQVIHGAATFESSMNREQMKICNIFMYGFLLRVINVMMKNNTKDWGQINYPPLP